jgi:hypothetical protein
LLIGWQSSGGLLKHGLQDPQGGRIRRSLLSEHRATSKSKVEFATHVPAPSVGYPTKEEKLTPGDFERAGYMFIITGNDHSGVGD